MLWINFHIKVLVGVFGIAGAISANEPFILMPVELGRFVVESTRVVS